MNNVEEYQKLIAKYYTLHQKGNIIDAVQLVNELMQLNPNISDRLIDGIIDKFKARGCQLINEDLINHHSFTDTISELEVPEESDNSWELSGLSSFKLLVKDLEHYKLLSPAEELEVAKAVSEGDELARERLITSNIRLVLTIARRYHRPGLELEDLTSEGILGLMRATELFDYTKGFRFSTYATWWIKQRIIRYISDKTRTIRLPLHIHDALSKLKTVRHSFEIEHGRQPSDEEVSEVLECSVEQVRHYLALIELYDKSLTSLDSLVGEEDDSSLQELISDPAVNVEEEVISGFARASIDELLSNLQERERKVLALRYGLEGEPRTLEEVGHVFGVTRERIRQIEQRALARLRRLSTSRGMNRYLAT